MEKLNSAVKIINIDDGESTIVEKYWTGHTIRSEPFRSEKESTEDIDRIFNMSPFHKEFLDLYGKHTNEVILDYGCGPGRDIIGFLLFTDAKKVIGIDVSITALNLTNHRLSFYNSIDYNRVSLIKNRDGTSNIPFASNSIDHILCSGVLHHISNPEEILKEFYRVLKPNSEARIMVYNRYSIWFHLQMIYKKGIIEEELKFRTPEEIWRANSDRGSPVSRTYTPEEFTVLCNSLGFNTEFLGGYISISELKIIKTHLNSALANRSLPQESREFLESLVYDKYGYPIYNGKYAGLGGSYVLHKKT